MAIRKPSLKESVTFLTTVSTLLMLVFGVSLTTTVGGFKAVFKAPNQIKQL